MGWLEEEKERPKGAQDVVAMSSLQLDINATAGGAGSPRFLPSPSCPQQAAAGLSDEQQQSNH